MYAGMLAGRRKNNKHMLSHASTSSSFLPRRVLSAKSRRCTAVYVCKRYTINPYLGGHVWSCAECLCTVAVGTAKCCVSGSNIPGSIHGWY